MLYIIAKWSGLRREIKNIKKIKANATKKRSYSISNSSSSDLYSYLPLFSDSERKEINKLDHVVTDNRNKNKNQAKVWW